MTTYTVTAANYNSSAFWSAISESTSGHVLDLTGLPSSFVVSVQQDINEIWIADGSFVYKIGEAGSGANFTLGAPTDMDFFSEVRVGDSPAWLLGSSENETLLSGAGNDTIEGGDGADDINGGAGDDTLDGGGGDDTLRGDAGDNLISGGDGNDRIVSRSNSRDTIEGGAGDDYITTGNLEQYVDGGAGSDTIIDSDIAGTSETDTLLGGMGAIPSCPTFRVQGTSKTGI